MVSSSSPPSGSRERDDVLADAGPGVLLEEAGLVDAAGAAHQRQRPVDDVGRDPRPDLGVELGEALLGDADVGPQHAVGVRERHRQRRRRALAFAVGASAATTSAACLSWRSPLNTAWRTMPSAVQPRNSTSATSAGLAQRTLRRTSAGGGSSSGGAGDAQIASSRRHRSSATRAGEARADAAGVAKVALGDQWPSTSEPMARRWVVEGT